jgi:hypothetical protein
MSVINERGTEFLVIDPSQLKSTQGNFSIILGYEKWTETDFWKKW